MSPIFFRSPTELRDWFKQNHSSEDELWVGYYKKSSGKPGITWQESVDVALCFGWIDSIRRSIDAVSYKNRITPRRPGSNWSAINIKRANELIEQGLMHEAGLKAFEARKKNKSAIYSNEQKRVELEEPYNKIFKKNKRAWKFFQSMPPYYRKTVNWWIVSAKKEETRLKRLQKLIDCSAQERKIPEMQIGNKN